MTLVVVRKNTHLYINIYIAELNSDHIYRRRWQRHCRRCRHSRLTKHCNS